MSHSTLSGYAVLERVDRKLQCATFIVLIEMLTWKHPETGV